MQKYIFINKQCPGDVMMLTAAVRDLMLNYPGKYQIGVNTSCMDLWRNNPYITKLDPKEAVQLKVGYPLIHKSNQCGLHFINGFLLDINSKLNVDAKLTAFRPDLHFTEDEKEIPLKVNGLEPGEPYWLITSGGKNDFTAKWWAPNKWQAVVDAMKGKIKFVQVGAAGHQHPKLRNVIDMVGKTPAFRDVMRLALHSQGICTIVTCFMHLAAALNKPCICVAGGREPYTWEAYDCYTREVNMRNADPNWTPPKDDDFIAHVYLHTMGLLPCCQKQACWRSKIGEGKDGTNCKDIVTRPGFPRQPRCMDMIQPDHVIAGLEYYLGLRNTPELAPVTNMIRIHAIPQNGKFAAAAPIMQTNTNYQIKEISSEAPKPLDRPKASFGQLPFTVMILMYDELGKYYSLHERVLKTLYENTPTDFFKLRIALNHCTDHTRKLIDEVAGTAGNLEKLYDHGDQNPKKYPLMREMYYDTDKPVLTDWVIWLDDDTFFDKKDWAHKLVARIEDLRTIEAAKRNPKGVHLLGKKFYMNLNEGNINWIKQAPWYTGRDIPKDKKGPKADFITGSFLVHTMEMFRELNWPDVRLGHNGGDMMLGVAAHQNGFGIVDHTYGVYPNKAARRGFWEKAPRA